MLCWKLNRCETGVEGCLGIYLLKREVRFKSDAVPQLYLGAIRDSHCLQLHEDGKVRKVMIISQETCLFQHTSIPTRIGGVKCERLKHVFLWN